MLRFVAKSLLFLLLAWGGLALYIEFGSMNFQNREYPMWRYKHERMHEKAPKPHDILVFGDSACLAGIKPLVLSPDALSLAVGGSTVIEAYYALKNYLRHNPPPAKALLSVTPLHFGEYEYFWNRNVRFKFLSTSEYLELFQRAVDLNSPLFKVSRGKSHPLLHLLGEYLALRLNLPHRYRAELSAALVFTRRAENREAYAGLVQSKGHAYFGTRPRSNGLLPLNRRTHFRTDPLLDAYLKDFFDLCREHGIRVIFTTIPINERAHKALKPQLKKQYTAHLKKLQKQYPEVHFDLEFEGWPANHFGDTAHMNKRGAARLSKELKKRYFSD